MKKIIHVTLMVSVTILFLTCKEKKVRERANCSESNTVKIPSNAISKLYFKDSTYWLYQDSNTLYVDSTFVTNSKRDVFNEFQDHKLYERCYESFRYEIYSAISGRSLIDLQPNSVSDNNVYTDEFFVVFYWMEANGYLGNARFTFEGNRFSNSGGNGGDSIYFLDSFHVKNNNYKNVIHHVNYSNTADIYKEAWYADSIGLIKYRMKNNSIWELLKCKIVK